MTALDTFNSLVVAGARCRFISWWREAPYEREIVHRGQTLIEFKDAKGKSSWLDRPHQNEIEEVEPNVFVILYKDCDETLVYDFREGKQ